MELTKEQEDFLEAEGKITLCACPGSGKTYTVAKKLIRYIKTWPYTHRGVATLSFTNVAREEVLRQTTDLSVENYYQVVYPHFVGTLDSFINKFIFLRFGYLDHNKKRPQIIYGNHGILNFRSPNKICHNKGCTRNPQWFHWSSQGDLLRRNTPINCEVNPKPCVDFKKRLLQKGIIMQSEVPALSLQLLKKHPAIPIELAYRFPVIIVDEAQDTSADQIEILDILMDAGMQTLILVGDPDQAIYEWRDATPEYFKGKINDQKWTNLSLTSNFRSSQKICDATCHFSSVLSGGNPVNTRGEFRNYRCKPILLQVEEGKSDKDIVEAFKFICSQHLVKSSAILTRSRIHSETDIPDLWKSLEIYLLASATYQWHHSSHKNAYDLCEKVLYSMTRGPIEGLTSENIRKSIEESMDYSLWKGKVISLLSRLPLANLSLNEWKQEMLKIIQDLIDSEIITLQENKELLEIIKLKTRDKKHPQFLGRPLIEYFEKRVTSDITVSSVHGVKGETFDAVLLITKKKGTNTITLKVLEKDSLDSELIRIAYVAMTRPRKILVVAIAKPDERLTRFPPELWDYQELK